ncbi:MAG: hypothetical protein HY714_05725 [Candidatus Omnitrophica bacterium]|nr:hypothetical protein [Candidatus Omnitrophota bacterium]
MLRNFLKYGGIFVIVSSVLYLLLVLMLGSAIFISDAQSNSKSEKIFGQLSWHLAYEVIPAPGRISRQKGLVPANSDDAVVSILIYGICAQAVYITLVHFGRKRA